MIIALVIVSFVVGSIPTGQVIAKTRGIDLRKVGSGNIGATNVMRVLGKEAALLTLLGDVAKGAVPVLVARLVHFPEHAVLYEGVVGLAAILGHNFSLFLKLRGGKGVATSFGVLFVLSPYVALFTVTLWLMTLRWTSYSSLSALVSFGLLPLNVVIIDYSEEKLIIASAITLFVFLRHVDNIKRLLQGNETKIGQKL